jgi:hypothetical protein
MLGFFAQKIWCENLLPNFLLYALLDLYYHKIVIKKKCLFYVIKYMWTIN